MRALHLFYFPILKTSRIYIMYSSMYFQIRTLLFSLMSLHLCQHLFKDICLFSFFIQYYQSGIFLQLINTGCEEHTHLRQAWNLPLLILFSPPFLLFLCETLLSLSLCLSLPLLFLCPVQPPPFFFPCSVCVYVYVCVCVCINTCARAY